MLGRSDPLAADLDDVLVVDRLVQCASADAVAGFEHEHAVPAILEFRGGRESGEPGADHHDITNVRSRHDDPPAKFY
ncbi:hypothetical protein NN3_59770 [Nocardia neocaledoniensis NBRC 108232]|nr:hypothetical protein NN3_59770 [Nocardia neocaledoniensis NBRC 108232]